MPTKQESNWSKKQWSLECWYRFSLVFRRKSNANRTQTGLKYTLVLTKLIQNPPGIQKNTKGQQESNWSKIHTGPHNAGIESVWYLHNVHVGENQMPTGIKLL